MNFPSNVGILITFMQVIQVIVPLLSKISVYYIGLKIFS
jgi:hypothetical protein